MRTQNKKMKKPRMEKSRGIGKSAALNMLDFPRMFMIIVAVFIILYTLPAFASINTKNTAAEQMVLDRLIFNSVSSFSYLDGNGRVHPGIVDLEKFNQEYMVNSIILPKKGGILLELSSDDVLIKRKISTNEDYALLSGGLISTFDVEKRKEPVIIKDKDKFIQGTLEITYVINKNK